MKGKLIALVLATVAFGFSFSCEAVVVKIGGPGVCLTYRQPVQAVIVAPGGGTVQQTVYYDPSLGGVDLDASWAGPNASIYFPAYQTSYVWYNGFWVDQAGYYWDGSRRVYIAPAYWHDHWAGYWHNHWHEGWRGGWHPHANVSVHFHETFHEHGHRHHR